MKAWDELQNSVEYLSAEDLEELREVFELAKDFHSEQERITGEPYIFHPVSVAQILAELELGLVTLKVALLHDVLDHELTDISELEDEISDEVLEILEGVTQLKNLEFLQAEETSQEILRQTVLGLSSDLRALLVKLAEKLDNLETLEVLPDKKRYKKASESIEIYAPLAERLSLGEWRRMLEDRAFPHYLPEEYKRAKQMMEEEIEKREQTVEEAINKVEDLLGDTSVEVQDIKGRAKGLYSYYRKLKKYDFDPEEIHDEIALRVIVSGISECYEALGVIHREWPPLSETIDDYIAKPKPNGYQSLHTVVLFDSGDFIEIQIRTEEMHERAEFGPAAHWRYSQSKSSKAPTTASYEDTLIEWQKTLAEKDTFDDDFVLNIPTDRIFVFTPDQDVKSLPRGASVVDFAYAVHSEIAEEMSGAKVNGKMVGLDYVLENGDVCEIVKNSNASGPKRKWLEWAKSPSARTEIRRQLRKRGIEL